jgi:undecaprenyl-diphosphatase
LNSAVFEALVLGIIQGMTEFLPVSSDGHLALAGFLFGFEEGGLTLTVLLHTGTLLATALVLHERVGRTIAAGVRGLWRPSSLLQADAGRDALFVVCASVPTGIIGLLLRDTVAKWTYSPLVVGVGFLVTALVLAATAWAPQGEGAHPSVRAALIVGTMQGLAVAPGISRSGLTIASLLFLGVQRGRAFELSMLMSLPVVFAAVLLEAMSHASELAGLGVAALGTVVAFVSGVAALLVLRRIVVGGRFHWFALWVMPLALATLAMARAWPR